MEPASPPQGRTPSPQAPVHSPGTAAGTRLPQRPAGTGAPALTLPTSQQGTGPAGMGQQPSTAEPTGSTAPRESLPFGATGHSQARSRRTRSPDPALGHPPVAPGSAAPGPAAPGHSPAPSPAPGPAAPPAGPSRPTANKVASRAHGALSPRGPAVHPRPVTPHSKSPVRRRRPAAPAPPPAASMPAGRRAHGPTGSARRPAHCACAPAAHSMPERALCRLRTTTPSGQRANVTSLAEASQ